MKTLICSIFVLLAWLGTANALTPIARVDVVPYQRIEYGETFNFGVVAFSKAGIDRVDFVISGQGYSGGTKTASSMTLNSKTDVWEYWVPIASSEFTGNGAITVTPTVVGEDTDTRELASITLYVYGASSYTPHQAWVDGSSGNDSTCEADNEALPCETINTAVSVARTANGGMDNGNEILLKTGTYYITDLSPSVTEQWLTIAADDGVDVDDVVITATAGEHRYNSGFHFRGLTLLSGGSGVEVLEIGAGNRLWIDGCVLQGSGRTVSLSNPVTNSSTAMVYYTDSQLYDIGTIATMYSQLVRNTDMERLGNDALQNTYLAVNVNIHSQYNPESPSTHADAFQLLYIENPDDNIILYNVKGTDLRYQGTWINGVDGGTNIAFVNVVLELREPFYQNEADNYAQGTLKTNASMDHFLVWHCTFPYAGASINATYTNSSMVGNYFWQYRDTDDDDFAADNADNNYAAYNHYAHVYGVTPTCTGTTKDIYESAGCPHISAIASGTDYTTGDGKLYDSYLNSDFLEPVAGSDLIGAVPSIIPADLYGTARGSTSDIGAVEYVSDGGSEWPAGTVFPFRSAGGAIWATPAD